MQMGTSAVSCVEGEGVRKKRMERARERKKARRLSLPPRPMPALLRRLTCHNHFLQSASQAPTRKPASVFGRRGQVELLFLFFLPFLFPGFVRLLHCKRKLRDILLFSFQMDIREKKKR